MKRTLGVVAAAFFAGSAAFGQDTAAKTGGATPVDNSYNVVENTSAPAGGGAYAATYRKGVADFRAGRLTEAAAAMQVVEKQAPNNVTAHSVLGYIYLKQNRSQEAVTEMETVVRLSPKDPGARKNLGRAYLQTSQPEKAAAQFSAVLALSPLDSDARFGLATAQGQAGQYDASAANFEKAAASKPSSITYQNLGVVLQKAGRNADAAAAFQKAADLDGANSISLLNAGLLYAQTGANDKAIADLTQAIAHDTDYKYEAHLTLAQAYHNTGNDAKAISEFNTAAQIRPTEATPLFNLAVLQQQAGQTADAEQSYQKALDLKPTDPQILVQSETNLGLLYANDGKAEQAIPLLSAAAQADPKAAAPHAALGSLYAKQGNAAQALAERKLAVDLNPTDGQTRLLLADAYLGQKRYADAAEQYAAVAQTDPRNSSVQNALGSSYARSGDTARALAAFQAALAGSGGAREKAQAQNNSGFVYEKQGKRAQAIAAYRKAVALDPTLPEARKNLARFSGK